MANVETGRELGKALLNVLNISSKMVKSISIVANASEAATVKIERFIDTAEAKNLAEVLEGLQATQTETYELSEQHPETDGIDTGKDG